MIRQALAASSRAFCSSPRIFIQRTLSRPPTFTASVAIRRIQPAAARCYSEAHEEPKDSKERDKVESATEKSSKDDGQEVLPAEPPAEDAAVTELKTRLATIEEEVADWKDKCLRSVANFRNLQERTQREIKNAREFALQVFAKDLVDSVDNFDRALSMVSNEKLKEAEKSENLQDLVQLYQGLKMTESILMNTLKKHGLERFDPLGEKFNPNEHEATFMAPREGSEDNTVFLTQQKGFKLNGRVLRAAKVGVVKNNETS